MDSRTPRELKLQEIFDREVLRRIDLPSLFPPVFLSFHRSSQVGKRRSMPNALRESTMRDNAGYIFHEQREQFQIFS